MIAGKNPASAAPSREPDDVERGLALHCRHSRGEETPRQQDPGDPLSGTEPHHAGVAGDLEDGVPDEEDPSAQPVSGRAEADVLAHRQLREANIVPIEERNEIQKHDQRQHPPLDLGGSCDRLIHLVIRRVFGIRAITASNHERDVNGDENSAGRDA